MTRPQPFPESASYRAVIRALLRMHQFALDGEDESEEAESLRNSMSEPWEGLSPVERDRVTGLSKDLYEISDYAEHGLEPMSAQQHGDLSDMYEARERGEWDKALELLRRLGRHMPPALVCYLRGTLWVAAGDLAVAAIFFEQASRLEPTNTKYQATLVHA